jgi:ABC-2 type transport system ATP-binding protein
MKDDIAIKINNVSKYFEPSKGRGSVKQAFANVLKKKEKYSKDGYWALKDIDFEIKKGEFFGIVGRNGSGKSTLLKMIAGVYSPTKGNIQVNGKLVPFIELGVGFNPELSGRDNVFLNGALLGFNRKEMTAMYDEIVEFAELQDHMDVKLKNFSSGMQVRLAFSIAIRAKSDVLLIDEVLAVGDTLFQQKCYEYFYGLKKTGQTVVFVSHDLDAVTKFCTSAALIEDQRLVVVGKPATIAREYQTRLYEEKDNTDTVKADPSHQGPRHFKITANKRTICFNETIDFSINWEADLGVKNIGLAVFSVDGIYVHGTNSIIQKEDLSTVTSAKITVKTPLSPGKYSVTVGLFGDNDSQVIELCQNTCNFIVTRSSNVAEGEWQGMVYLESDWEAISV